MKTKYWLCKRKEIFFSFDSTTGKRESLHTADREAAKQIIRAKNDAATQPAINISIAKPFPVYLAEWPVNKRTILTAVPVR
jgi:hypothetical protein